MRCTQCNFPLAPKRTRCPRCGAEIVGRSSERPKVPSEITPLSPYGQNAMPANYGMEQNQQAWGAYPPVQNQQNQVPGAPPMAPAANMNGQAFAPPPQYFAPGASQPAQPGFPQGQMGDQQFFAAQNQMPGAPPMAPTANMNGQAFAPPPQNFAPGVPSQVSPSYAMNEQPPTPAYQNQGIPSPSNAFAPPQPGSGIISGSQPQLHLPPTPVEMSNPWPAQSFSPAAHSQQGTPGTFLPQTPQPFVAARKSAKFRFTIAGLCVFTGGLILIFVYIMSLNLSAMTTSMPSNQQQTGALQNSQTSTPAIAATPTAQSVNNPTPTVGITPTAKTESFPGKQYVDAVQMASAINPNTAQATQAETTFKVGQQIYVVFQLHPQGQTGAVCLNWFLNDKEFNHFQFMVTPHDQPGYSFTYPGSTGEAYVDISWSSNGSCSDKILAQRARFKVV